MRYFFLSPSPNFSIAYLNSATDATITFDFIDLSEATDANLTFSWYISSWDSGEYICLDIYDGSWHTSVDCIDGNVDSEDTWIDKEFDLDAGYIMVSDFQVRFRAKVSSSSEDGFVDVVNVTKYG